MRSIGSEGLKPNLTVLPQALLNRGAPPLTAATKDTPNSAVWSTTTHGHDAGLKQASIVGHGWG